MGRIFNYPVEPDILGTDRWIGSETHTASRLTKNFTPDKVAKYFNKSSVLDNGTFSWNYAPYSNTQIQSHKTFWKIGFGESQIDVIDLQGDIRVSALTLANTTPGIFISSQWQGKYIIVKVPNEPSQYGIYFVNSITSDGDFYIINLDFVEGNSGSILMGNPMSFGLYQSTLTSYVESVFGRSGVVTAQEGDYDTDLVTEGASNKYFTEPRVLSTLLAGYNPVAGTISDTDSILSAFNKIGGNMAGFVPYSGATGNVSLGEFGISGGYFDLDQTPTQSAAVARIMWDDFYGTPFVMLKGGNVKLQIGQEQVTLIHNNTGSELTDGQVVYITGSTGELPNVALASNTTEVTSSVTLGVVTEPIPHGSNGYINTSGLVNGLNTNAFIEGEPIYLGSIAGTFTHTKPTSPNHIVLIGYVVKKAGGNGSIYVKVQNTQELKESSDVLFSSLTNNDLLVYESATSLWKNKSISTILGGTIIVGSGIANQVAYFTDVNTVSSLDTATYPSLSELSYVKGVTSSIQSQISSKQDVLSGTGFVKSTAGTISYDTTSYYPASNPNGYTSNAGTVTSVSASVPIGFDISGSPITTSGTLVVTFTTGYSLPSNALQATWTAKQDALSGTGFVKSASGVISYDTNTYLTTSSAASTYQPLLSLTSGYIPKATGTSTLGNSSFFENTNGIGLNTATPQSLVGAGFTIDGVTNAALYFANSGTLKAYISGYSGGMLINAYTGALSLQSGGGNVLVNTVVDAGYNLDVSGTFRATGAGTFGSTVTASNGTLIGGTLSSGYIPKATGTSTLGNSLLFENETGIGVGTASPGGRFEIYVGASGATAISNGSHLIIQNSAAVGMSLLSPDANAARFYFGTASNSRNAMIYSDYNSGSQTLAFYVGSGAVAATERMRLNSIGHLLLGTTTDDTVNMLQVNGNIKSSQYRLSSLNTAPSSASDTGILGEIRIDASYIFVCTATNTWKRSAIITW